MTKDFGTKVLFITENWYASNMALNPYYVYDNIVCQMYGMFKKNTRICTLYSIGILYSTVYD
jgi:hypothetical protein